MPRWDDNNRMPLALVRAKAGFTIEKAAVAINLASRTLGRYENGFGDITMKVAEKLAELYRVPFESIREAVRETYLLKQNGGN